MVIAYSTSDFAACFGVLTKKVSDGAAPHRLGIVEIENVTNEIRAIVEANW